MLGAGDVTPHHYLLVSPPPPPQRTDAARAGGGGRQHRDGDAFPPHPTTLRCEPPRRPGQGNSGRVSESLVFI